jgi:hypothetical protein
MISWSLFVGEQVRDKIVERLSQEPAVAGIADGNRKGKTYGLPPTFQCDAQHNTNARGISFSEATTFMR